MKDTEHGSWPGAENERGPHRWGGYERTLRLRAVTLLVVAVSMTALLTLGNYLG
ncbi:hypothetical protein Asp14428_71870 [Actinoplanes sp. NBRC 14428]|uniref:Uncharacterized protein n=1 Tax=Pseudosporangium ferrugineum TaxID=439699 RepID=A0A2T0S281_9ACTN|nr:hypothetical protein [Pseudosporangium ferrugineum]PRY27525.1 hypothetical protein CLV70_110112 [Pseudosporangium ferrugineum]BCJ55712.1 hypothetical protein Asp14428_71870 [Actinoplanes sp. NBRC 14428]